MNIRWLIALACLAFASTAAAEPCTVSSVNSDGSVRYVKCDRGKVKGRKGEEMVVAPVPPPPPTSGFVAVAANASLDAGLAAAFTSAQSVPTTVLLACDGRWTGNWLLPRTAYPITLTTEDRCLPMPGVRITPMAESTIPQLLPAQLSSSTVTIRGDNYTFRGVQFGTPGVGYTTIDLDATAQPKNTTFDQVLIRGDATTGGHRGIAANGPNVTVKNSWIDRMWEVGRDAQAIAAWDSPGPLTITNNYLEASGENFLTGGSAPTTCGCIPTDIVFTGNTVEKNPAWRLMTPQPQVKNLFELKTGRRVTVTDNRFRYNWQQAQTGWSILMTPLDDSGPAPVVEDVVFSRNVIRDVASGMNIAAVSGPIRRVKIEQNVWANLDHEQWGGDGRLGIIQTQTAGIEDLAIVHNTVIGLTGNQFLGIYGDVPLVRFVMTHNIVEHRDYGIHSTMGLAEAALTAMAPGSVFRDNAIIGPADDGLKWPAGNVTLDVPIAEQFDADYRIVASSPLLMLMTSDGTMVGASP